MTNFNESLLEFLRLAAATEIQENAWYCDGCCSEKSRQEVTYSENCTGCGMAVKWVEHNGFIAHARNFAEQYKEELRGIAEGEPVAKNIVKRAFQAGWEISGQGCNGEKFSGDVEDYLKRGFEVFAKSAEKNGYAHPPTTKPDDGCYISREDAGQLRDALADAIEILLCNAYLTDQHTRALAILDSALGEKP